jgi:hypothetical protein
VRYSRPLAAFILVMFLVESTFNVAAGTEEQERSAAALANPVAAQPLDQLSTILNRPLFSPSRRPPAPSPLPVVQGPASPVPPPPPPSLVLLGVVMDGESARVLVRAGADKKLMRAQIGDEIDGWKVSQIEARKVVLSLDGRFATFNLFNDDRGESDANGGAASGESKSSQVQQAPSPAGAPQPFQSRKLRSRE